MTTTTQANTNVLDTSMWIDQVIDERYQIIELLGEGGMGAVFAATHLKLNKIVAIKMILPEFAGNAEIAMRFAREAMANARIEHPHIACAIDYGTLPSGVAYLVMQYAKGRPLSAWLDDGPQTWQQSCAIGEQIADALSVAHEAGIIHRDLKPDNVMLEARTEAPPYVRVLDFGVARLSGIAAKAGHTLTRAGTVIGTPGYMAPEQALGEAVDARADLYSLGLLLRALVSGENLFAGMNLTQIVTWQLTEIPAQLHGIPAPLADLIDDLLARERDKRPADATVVRDRLREIMLNATVEAVIQRESNLAVRTSTPSELAHAATAIRGAIQSQQSTGADHVDVEETQTPKSQSTSKTLPSLTPALMVMGALALLLTVSALFGAWFFVTRLNPLDSRASTTGINETSDAPLPAVPSALEAQTFVLIQGVLRRDRRAAATIILEHEPQDTLPTFLRLAAEFENQRGCTSRRALLNDLIETEDPRVLPILERLDRQPRNQCGNLLRRRDCLGCMRESIDSGRQRLRERFRYRAP